VKLTKDAFQKKMVNEPTGAYLLTLPIKWIPLKAVTEVNNDKWETSKEVFIHPGRLLLEHQHTLSRPGDRQ
jgi:hypothetical protein